MYRLWQFWRALTGTISTDDMRFVATALTPAEQHLFARLPRYDQRHAVDVARLLVAEGTTDSTVVAVALLHDIGKVHDDGTPLGLLWYGVIVVAQRVPRCYAWLAQWCEPVRRHATHELRSATRAQQSGARADVVALLTAVAHRADSVTVRLLQEADDRC